MSPRAACRLEMLGFERVYDYVPGKSDWLARGLPTEGTTPRRRRVGGFARDDVVTCGVADRVGTVRSRVAESGYGFALVTTDHGTLLGRVRTSAIDHADPDAVAESLMESGPSTVRPDVEAAKLAARLADRGLRTAIVTSPEGQLIGAVRREDLP